MKAFADLSGLDRLIARANSLADPAWLDAVPLMKNWMDIIERDNREGVLAGTDKDGGYMIATTYRPKGKVVKPTATNKNNVKGRVKKGAFSGFGPATSGWNNNLTWWEYQRLDGPPLAPRGRFSRVITNLETDYRQDSPTEWVAFGYWRDVVDRDGKPFLHYHFDGDGLPRRDLRGVRPEGRERARKAAINWLRDQIRWLNDPAAVLT